jgi:aminoglycoside phosphotransferase (APT) family kinase protein
MEKQDATVGGAQAALSATLARVLAERVAGFRSLHSCERLSGGASQETYRVVIDTADGTRTLAMRRAPGGSRYAFSGTSPGLGAEAKLLGAARAAGVPEPAILHVFEERDGLGDGFLMEWLDGETLGARITRAPELDAVRPQLARQCGAVLARIHAIDVRAAGLADVLQQRTPEQLVRENWELYQAYNTPQPMIDFAARWLLEHLPPVAPPRLVHGDFRNGNLMISAERCATSVGCAPTPGASAAVICRSAASG